MQGVCLLVGEAERGVSVGGCEVLLTRWIIQLA